MKGRSSKIITSSVKQCFIIPLFGLMFIGCASNALFFHETTKFAFVVEYKPDSSQPINSSLGYKRRIVAVVPPQQPVSQSGSQNPNALHKGEALSLVSRFDVEAQATLGAKIHSDFASGMAARKMTKAPNAHASIQALFAPETIREVAVALQTRKVALIQRLPNNEVQAKQILTKLQVQVASTQDPDCKGKEAICTLQDHISHAYSENDVTKIEEAFNRVLPAH